MDTQNRMFSARQRSICNALTAVLFLLFMSGCVSTPVKEVSENKSPPKWPQGTESSRYVYETVLRSSKDIERQKPEDRLLEILTNNNKKDGITFDKPHSVAAWHGKIYVTDSMGAVIHVFDVPRRRYFQFGHRFEGKVIKPLGVAISAAGVYVADVKRRIAIGYDHYGLYRVEFGGIGDMDQPTDVAVNHDGSRIYVVDTGGIDSNRHRVLMFDSKGKQMGVIGTRGHKQGEFNLPSAAVVAADGTLYVLDSGNFRVQAFDPNGKFLRSWGSVGKGLGQFSRPRDIAIDRDGNVLVSDANFDNVQLFTPDGQLLMHIGQASRVDKPGGYALISGITVDETGRLYIVDQVFRKTEVIRSALKNDK